MRDARLASSGRAAAAVAASIALHLALAAGSTAVLLGGVLGAASVDDRPLHVEIVAEEPRAPAAPAPRRGPRAVPARPTPVASAPAATAADQESAGSTAMAPGEVSSLASAAPDVSAEIAGDAISAGAIPAGEVPAGNDMARGAEAPASLERPDLPFPEEAVTASLPPSLPAQMVTASLRPSLPVDGQPDSPVARDAADAPGGDAVADSGIAVAPGGDAAASAPAPVEESAVAVARGRLGEVTRNPSVSARAESEPFVGRRDVFEFLLDHPDFATHVTRALRLARYRVWRTDDGMFIDDGWGATGQLTVIHAASGSRVVYAKGEFQGKFLPTIPGEAVVTIDYDTWPTADGREMLHARISGQLKIEGALAGLVLKVASSVAIEKAEKESRRLVTTMARVLRAIDETPAAVYASLRERPDVPRVELEQFRALLRLP